MHADNLRMHFRCLFDGLHCSVEPLPPKSLTPAAAADAGARLEVFAKQSNGPHQLEHVLPQSQ